MLTYKLKKLQNMLRMCLLFSFLAFLVQPSFAKEILKLDETCTVNILNRAIQANEFGRFAMPNVPSFMGRIRARATCVGGGVTVSAQTDYFSEHRWGSELASCLLEQFVIFLRFDHKKARGKT